MRLAATLPTAHANASTRRRPFVTPATGRWELCQSHLVGNAERPQGCRLRRCAPRGVPMDEREALLRPVKESERRLFPGCGAALPRARGGLAA